MGFFLLEEFFSAPETTFMLCYAAQDSLVSILEDIKIFILYCLDVSRIHHLLLIIPKFFSLVLTNKVSSIDTNLSSKFAFDILSF